MDKKVFKVFSFVTILTLMLVAMPAQSAQAVSPDVVISQVYGGGGNSGATYTHDFIELFNRGTSSVSLAGWSVQYASATGTGNFGANSGQLSELPSVWPTCTRSIFANSRGDQRGSRIIHFQLPMLRMAPQ